MSGPRRISRSSRRSWARGERLRAHRELSGAPRYNDRACRGGDKNYEAMIQRGLDFLNSRKTVDGFEEKEFTGTGFPLHFYLRYDGYRKFFPAIALGRLQHSS